MRRRQFLTKTSTVALGTTALASGVGVADRGRSSLPNENVPHAVVSPFAVLGVQPVSTGEWIVHRVGWVSSTKADVEDFLAKCDLSVWVDGEPVDELDSYRGDIVEEDGDWYVWWRYATPPKSPGKYEFRARFEFTEALSNGTRDAGDVDDVTGTYEVSADNPKNKGK